MNVQNTTVINFFSNWLFLVASKSVSFVCITLVLMGLVSMVGCSEDSNLSDQQALQKLATMIVGNVESGASETEDSVKGDKAKASTAPTNESETIEPETIEPKTIEPETIEWTDLMPKDDLEALANPPEYVADIADGSMEDKITGQLKNSPSAPSVSAEEQRYQQALVSTKVVPEMANKHIRIPGFVVPVAFNDQEQITEFFLVPFFGACIHMPAPPPNQIIFVKYPQGFRIEHLFDPILASGKLTIALKENDLATAAYALTMTAFGPYEYRG